MDLTVAIPTFNRNNLLQENIKYLLPQLADRGKLLIIDNCSDTPVFETLKDVLASYPQLDVTLVRNKVNVGGNENILRCLEKCDTKWLWILGDDDQVRPDAIQTIFTTLDEYPECLFFNYAFTKASLPTRTGTVITEGVKEFVSNIDSLGYIGFNPTCIFNAEALLPNIRFGYHYQFSCLPTTVILLKSLGDKGGCCLSEKQIIDRFSLAELADQSSALVIALGISAIFDVPQDNSVRQELAKKVLQWLHADKYPRVIVRELLKIHADQRDSQSIRYYYKTVYNRLFIHNRNIRQRLECNLYKYLLYFPRLSTFLLSLAFDLLGKKGQFLIEKKTERYFH